MELAKSFAVFALSLGICVNAEEEMQFTKGTGDMGHYIIQQALKCGANVVTTNDLPALKGEWKFSEDRFGAVLQLGPERFEEVQAFLCKAFGPPSHEADATTDGGKLGWYAARTTGIGLQFGYNKERTQVIVLRPQKRSEVYRRAEALAKTESEKKVYGDLARDAKKQEKKQDEKK
jgi:hypothetical protein